MSARVRYGVAAAPAALAIATLLFGCGGREGGPAPVVQGYGDMSPGFAAPPPLPPSVPLSPRPPLRVKVARGDSLSVLAHRYHVPERALIEANHLQPPYKVRLGSTLLIPGGAAIAEPAPPLAAAPPPHEPVPLVPRSPAAAPPPRQAPTAVAAARPVRGPAAEVAADIAAEGHAPASKQPPHTLTPPRPERLAEKTSPPEKPRPPAAVPPQAAHAGGGFLWPVHGRVLDNYGAGADGTRNDGINIAAPKGTPVEAADAGVVAYAGNELRGYGNLILIKHAGGWISAYAHCEDILVKRGQKVGRGQTIARVGASGSVKQPQLHFELRRGDHPVDPRGLLAPLPTAAAGRPAPPG
jgi:murein DD-endopeptidase MepM/ murein hydrolase activator NlpD